MSCAQIQTNWDYEEKTVFLKKNTSNDVINYLINSHANRDWEFVSSTELTSLGCCLTYTFRKIRSNN